MSTTMMSPDEIRGRVRELGEWFHNINLGGVETAPDHFLDDYPAIKWARFAHAIPADLAGCSVLDVGCNAGFYSIEMKRRGASRVLGVDTDARYLAQARFAASVADADVEFREMSVYQLPALEERFDIVLFMGVLYHVRHPVLALDILYEHAASDLLVFQSMLRGAATTREFQRDTSSGSRNSSRIRHTPGCCSSSINTRAIRRTGGSRTARVPRRCCEAQDSRSSSIRKTKYLSAVEVIARRSTGRSCRRG